MQPVRSAESYASISICKEFIVCKCFSELTAWELAGIQVIFGRAGIGTVGRHILMSAHKPLASFQRVRGLVLAPWMKSRLGDYILRPPPSFHQKKNPSQIRDVPPSDAFLQTPKDVPTDWVQAMLVCQHGPGAPAVLALDSSAETQRRDDRCLFQAVPHRTPCTDKTSSCTVMDVLSLEDLGLFPLKVPAPGVT